MNSGFYHSVCLEKSFNNIYRKIGAKNFAQLLAVAHLKTALILILNHIHIYILLYRFHSNHSNVVYLMFICFNSVKIVKKTLKMNSKMNFLNSKIFSDSILSAILRFGWHIPVIKWMLNLITQQYYQKVSNCVFLIFSSFIFW